MTAPNPYLAPREQGSPARLMMPSELRQSVMLCAWMLGLLFSIFLVSGAVYVALVLAASIYQPA